jgi:hypothetical protein
VRPDKRRCFAKLFTPQEYEREPQTLGCLIDTWFAIFVDDGKENLPPANSRAIERLPNQCFDCLG